MIVTIRAYAPVLLCIGAIVTAPVVAQIVRDGSIGPDVSSQSTGPDYVIPQNFGEQAGSNLFHSFSQFNVHAGESATFTSDGATPIENVISRVTGTEQSDINGLLRSTIPGADFYLINPNGVLIGESAQLDIDGAFKVGASQSLEFTEGEAFDVNAQPPILNHTDPAGFGFLGENAGAVTLNGSVLRNPGGFEFAGDQVNITYSLLASSTDSGEPAGDIVLHAEDGVVLDDVYITSESLAGASGDAGDVRIEASTVKFKTGTWIKTATFGTGDAGSIYIDASNAIAIGDVGPLGGSRLLTQAEAGSSGNTGVVTMNARSIDLSEGAAVAALTFGTGDAGDISLNADERVTLSGNDGVISSFVASTTVFEGDAGNVLVEAPQVELLDGGRIESASHYTGNAGELTINAASVLRMSGIDPQSNGAFLSTVAWWDDGDASAGDINVQAGNIELTDGAAIGSEAFAGGDSGAVTLIASDRLTLSGINQNLKPASIIATTVDGQGGAIAIQASSVALGDGAAVQTGTFGSGNSGGISFQVDGGLTFSGTNTFGTGSFLTATSFAGSTGGAGSVTIDAQWIDLNDGARIAVRSEGVGSSGDIVLNADTHVTLSGAGEDTGAFLSAETFTAGDAGRVLVTAPVVALRDGAYINTSTDGSGNAGEIVVNAANSLTLSGVNGRGLGGVITSFAKPGSTGSGGGITIATSTLALMDGAVFGADSLGAGDAGDIRINADERILMSGADLSGRGALISAATFEEGAGGDIFLSAPVIDLTDGALIEAATFGPGASVLIQSPLAAPDFANVDSLAAATNHSGNIVVNAGAISLSGKSNITTRSLGTGDAGLISLTVGSLRLNQSQISTNSLFTRGGDIFLQSPGLVSLTDSGVFTNVTSGAGGGGNIDIATPRVLLLRSSQIQANASQTQGVGGDITLSAGNFFVSLDSTIEATAAIDGTILQDGSADEDSEPSLPEVSYLDANELLAPQCVRRGVSSHFAVASHSGVAPSPDELLPSFDSALLRVAALSDVNRLERSDGEIAFADGAAAYRGGQFARAQTHWQEASLWHAARAQSAEASVALLALAQSQHALGAYAESVEPLQRAASLASKAGEAKHEASALAMLGDALLALNRPHRAQAALQRSARLAERTNRVTLRARVQNSLGNLIATRGVALERSTDAYIKSAELAVAGGDTLVEIKALANAARVALTQNNTVQARSFLEKASGTVDSLAATSDKASVLIHLAKSHEQLHQSAPDARYNHLAAAQALLLQAVTLSERLSDTRISSYALGNLGGLYGQEGRLQEALYMTRSAMRKAEAARAPESLYRWHWQEAELLWSNAARKLALESYARAVAVLEETRQDSLLRYADAAAYFRRMVAPVYLDYIDALIQSSDTGGARGDRFLRKARETSELLKSAELRNHFKDECLADLNAGMTTLDSVSPDAAVVYPIVLSNRLELLVSEAGVLTRHTVAVSAERLQRVAQEFRTLLQSGAALDAVQEHGGLLHEWLVAPYAARLSKAITTLVFVPDEALRGIPMAALHDGTGYLIERYAVAVTPSLALTDPTPLDVTQAKVLLAGVSEKVSEQFDALAKVPEELDAIQSLYGGDLLLNSTFTSAGFERALRDEEVSIVHIASHGVFTGRANDSFVLAYDGPLMFERLQDIVGITKFRERPLELLVLSACETAAGNDDAALGLAGLAVKAGARSALGSLWTIADEATAELMRAFYGHMKRDVGSKAAALRLAQLDLLKNPDWRHPTSWSAFLLINNWL